MTTFSSPSALPALDAGGPSTARSRVRALWALWVALAALGAIGVVQRITQGHLPAGYGSYVPWGLWIALYFHGVGIAGGAFVVGGIGYLLDWPGFNRPQVLRTVIVLSLAAIAPAFLGVWFDLGHMERAHRIFTSPSFTSMMAFNAWMYSAYAIVAVVAWVLSFKGTSSWLKPLLCLGIMLSVMFPSQSGAFFGVVDAKPHWHSSLLPVLFLASAVTAGSAMLLFVVALLSGLGRRDDWIDAAEAAAAIRRLRVIVLTALLIYVVLEFAEFSLSLWNPSAHAPAIELVLWGPYWWVFWLVHLAAGVVLPLVLLASRRPGAWTAAAVLLAVTLVSTRLNILVPGQAVGEIHGLQDAFNHERLNYVYHATAMEYLVGFFLVAVGMALFFIGRRVGAVVATRSATNA